MTPKEIVAKWIETEWFSHDPAIREVEASIVAGLVADIEAAVESEREACAQIVEKHVDDKWREEMTDEEKAALSKIQILLRNEEHINNASERVTLVEIEAALRTEITAKRNYRASYAQLLQDTIPLRLNASSRSTEPAEK